MNQKDIFKQISKKEIADIKKLTKSRYSEKGKYFYKSTGKGFRRGDFRLYVGVVGQDVPKITYIDHMQLYKHTFLAEKQSAYDSQNKKLTWGIVPIPNDWIIGLGKILKENYERK